YSKILQLCIRSKSLKSGQLIHSRLIIDGFPQNARLKTSLISFYSKIGDIGSARKVFDEMSERSLVAWSTLISGYCKCGDDVEALRVFASMHCAGIRANQFTYGSALSACTRLSCSESGNQVHCRVEKSRFVNNLFVQSALVDFHAKCGKIEDSRSVFESMERRDSVSWNVLIGGYAARRLTRNAMLTFCLMLREGILPDSFTFGNLLKCTTHGDEGLSKVGAIHGYVSKFGFGSHEFVIGCLVDAYVKCRSLATAHLLYSSLNEVDVVSCTALIKGYASEGVNLEKALLLFLEVHKETSTDEMLLCSMLGICAKAASLWLGKQIHATLVKCCHLHHDMAMSNSLIGMYSKSGGIEDAGLVFDEMPIRNVVSWTSLIAGCGMHGRGREALRLLSEMERERLEPNGVTLVSLLSACDHGGFTARAWEFIRTAVDGRGIELGPKHFACLADTLARAGYMDEAYDLACEFPGSESERASVLGSILGACSTYGNTKLGRIVAGSLFRLEPEKRTNYVVMAGIYAGAGLWNDATEMMRKKFRGEVKVPGHSCL
ncbi:hypothetical protein M569_09350, partial [Genlisea aurea]